MDPPHLTVDDVDALLGSAAARRPVEVGAVYTHLDHALQTAALLRDGAPDDAELAVAGLVHDLGHLLPGIGDAADAGAAAAGLRGALGRGVAGLVGLHVAAKRYLVAGEAEYGDGLSGGSVTSLRAQGGPMSSDERSAFEVSPWFADALTLRRADDRGKVDGLVVDGLEQWMPVVRGVAVGR